VQVNGTRLLIDCGFSIKETETRLGRLNLAAADLTAIVVTHEHTDHINGVGALARKYALPVWLTAGTLRAAEENLEGVQAVHIFTHHEPFGIDDVHVTPVVVPHDAREPAQYIFSDGNHRLGLLTDTGSITPHIRQLFDGLDAILLEFNHDEATLLAGPYPEALKQRIASDLGHLSNVQAAGLLTSINISRLQHLIAMHLSQQNNTPIWACTAAAAACNCAPEWIGIADQQKGFAWRQIL
jgi:phosphoribosyl 1,2-cyclic phosphodiesterase